MYSDEMERGEHDPMHSDEMDLIKGSSDTCAMEIEVQPMPPQPSTAVMEPNATEEEVKAIPQQGDLILADPEVDARQYFRGKQTRERLLARVGLLGEGSRFTLRMEVRRRALSCPCLQTPRRKRLRSSAFAPKWQCCRAVWPSRHRRFPWCRKASCRDSLVDTLMHSDEMDLIKGSSDTRAMELEVQPMPPQASAAVMEPNATEEEVKAIRQQGGYGTCGATTCATQSDPWHTVLDNPRSRKIKGEILLLVLLTHLLVLSTHLLVLWTHLLELWTHLLLLLTPPPLVIR